MVALQRIIPSRTTPVSGLQLILNNGEAIFDVVLEKPLVIGRNTETNRVTIDLSQYEGQQQGVSRRHVAISPMKGQVVVQDLKSANGTLINGVRVQTDRSYVLQSGDRLQLGKMLLTVWFTD